MMEPSPESGDRAAAPPSARAGRRVVRRVGRRFDRLHALRRWTIPVYLLAAVAPSALLSQPSESFADRLRVLEVEVPVHVLLRGKPVRGLSAGDFRVLDRGEEREIVGFDVLDLAVQRISGSQTPAEAPAEAPAVESVASRSFLVIVDFANNQGGYLGRGVSGLRRMVDEQLHAGDRMALVALGKRGSAGIVTGFTSDRTRLQHALDYLDALADRRRRRQREALAALLASAPSSPGEKTEAYGGVELEALGDLDSVIVTAGPEIDTSFAAESSAPIGSNAARAGGSGIEEAFALGESITNYQRYRDTELYAEALSNLGALLRGVSGQKHALLLSQGPPFDTFVTPTGSALDPPRDGGQGVAKAIERMTEQLSRSGWRIHTFGQGLGFNPSLFYLANETGGTAFENFNRLEVATAELVEQTNVTYLLRILASDVVADGSRHELEVRLVDPPRGVEIRHRPNYYAPRPEGELSRADRRLAEVERRLEQAVKLLRAGLLAISVPERGGRHVLIGLSIDAAEIRELSGRGFVEMEIEAFEGSREATDSLLYRVTLDQQTLARMPSGGVTFLGDLSLPNSASRIDVQVALEDRRLARTFALTGGADDGAITALPPLFFVSSGERVLVREANQGRPFEWPLRLGEDEIVPWIEPAVERGERLGAMLWLLGPSPTRLPAPVFVLTGEGGLRPSTEGVVTAREASSPGIPSADRSAHLAVIDTTELAPGSYRLEVLWPGIEHAPLLGSFRVIAPRR